MSSGPIVHVQSYDNNAQADNSTFLTGPDSECQTSSANDDEGLGLNIASGILSSPLSTQSQRFTSYPYHDINDTRQSPLIIGAELPKISFAPYDHVQHIADHDVSDAERQGIARLLSDNQWLSARWGTTDISDPESPYTPDSPYSLDSQFAPSSPSLCDAFQQQLHPDPSTYLTVPAPSK